LWSEAIAMAADDALIQAMRESRGRLRQLTAATNLL